MLQTTVSRPLAIAMWDFSWLERRWPGAGYEDWGRALDELADRGYDAVRIDAYPHLLALDPQREWEILPVWNQHSWGSPARTKVTVQPSLNEFVGQCRERGVKVALSSWFRRDVDDSRMLIKTPRDLAGVWSRTLDSIAAADLLDTLLYVDLCNEFPSHMWAPFFSPQASDNDSIVRNTPEGQRWMSESIEVVRAAYPQLDYCFSFISDFDKAENVSFLDLLELHIFLPADFDDQAGVRFDPFDASTYENVVRNAERLYRSNPEFWQQSLAAAIEVAADWSRHAAKPLVTTECWAVVMYKDWPLLDWGWIKELCEHGVRTASATGRWVGLSTSLFCGPQFVGMWRDVRWHRRLTDVIHNGPLPPLRPTGD